ncbi:MAG: class I SAM-dependent methyltransferase [Phenylobacterium sp.]
MTDDIDLARYRRLDAFLTRLHADVYAEAPSALHTTITQKMFAQLQQSHPPPPGAKVLDIGCGQGVALELFKAAGFDATGITFGEDVQACRAKGLNAVEMDFSFLEFDDEAFDLVWCRHAIEHSIFPYFTLSEIHRVLKPGGVLYLEVPAPDTARAHQNNRNHYSVLGKSMWLQLMGRAGFMEGVVTDMNLSLDSGPDTYWGFTLRKPRPGAA